MSTTAPGNGTDPSKNATLARGARLAFVGRAGALIEVLSLFLFAQMYGSETYGIFLVLWFVVQALAIFSDFGMTLALQRFIPADEDEINAGRILKYALSVSLTISCMVSISLTFAAPFLADFINANERDSQHLVDIIRLYAWAVPLWCLIDVCTAAIRAQQVFGPEIKVRVFYEQGFRLVFGSLFYFLGYLSFGLFISHLIGLAITAFFALRLIHRHYGLPLVFAKTGRDKALVRDMVSFASSMVLPNLAKKWHSGLPLLVLNVMIPGAQGAEAAGIYGIARKLVSFINVFRESLEYVLAPIASAHSKLEQKDQLQDMFRFATRLAICLIIPAATLIVCLRYGLMRLSGSEFLAGTLAVIILASGRVLEAGTGPSTAILTMIGRYRLPFINAVIGVALTGLLGVMLVPMGSMFADGLMGPIAAAALSAIIGINATAILANLEVRFLYDLRPYARQSVKPILVSLAFSAVLAGVILLTEDIWRPLHFVIGVIGFICALVGIMRYGFQREEAEIIIPRKVREKYPFLLPRNATTD